MDLPVQFHLSLLLGYRIEVPEMGRVAALIQFLNQEI